MAPRSAAFERITSKLQHPFVLGAAKHQIERTDDDAQQVVEIVRDAAGELPDRFHLLRLDQARLRALAFGDLSGEAVVG